jgi:hypothetical protein
MAQPITQFPFKGNGPQRKHVQKFFVADGIYLPSRCIAAVGEKDTHTDIQDIL